jgi:hypothetical protein
MKDFKQDFKKLFKKFQNSENFAFSRFSDGELRIMQNTELKLAGNYAKELTNILFHQSILSTGKSSWMHIDLKNIITM